MFQKDFLRVFILLKYHVCKVEGSEYNAVKNKLKLLVVDIWVSAHRRHVCYYTGMENLQAACYGSIPGNCVPTT